MLDYPLPAMPSPSPLPAADHATHPTSDPTLAHFGSWEEAALELLRRATWAPASPGEPAPLLDAHKEPTSTLAMLLVAVRLHGVLWEELAFRSGCLQPDRGVWLTKKHGRGDKPARQGEARHNPNRRLSMVVRVPGRHCLKLETFRSHEAVIMVRSCTFMTGMAVVQKHSWLLALFKTSSGSTQGRARCMLVLFGHSTPCCQTLPIAPCCQQSSTLLQAERHASSLIHAMQQGSPWALPQLRASPFPAALAANGQCADTQVELVMRWVVRWVVCLPGSGYA